MDKKETLVVISKLKKYIRSASGMNTAGGVAPALSDIVRQMCDEAIEKAKSDGRKTVMDRDFLQVAESEKKGDTLRQFAYLFLVSTHKPNISLPLSQIPLVFSWGRESELVCRNEGEVCLLPE